MYVNLGLEEDGNITTFNYTLTPQPLNTTGSGHLCLRRLPILDDIPDGTNASLQIVKVGASGNAMYNVSSPFPGLLVPHRRSAFGTTFFLRHEYPPHAKSSLADGLSACPYAVRRHLPHLRR